MKIVAVVPLYISHKRALGHRFQAEEVVLRAFCKVAGESSVGSIDTQSIVAFLGGSGNVTATWARKHRVLSGLFRFALARGLTRVSPLPRIIPKPTVPPFVPYIYSLAELRRLLDAVPAACAGRVTVEATVFRTLLLLLYGAALRLGEALALKLGEVQLPLAMLHIRETKFFKSRLVPVGKDLTGVLNTYLLERNANYCAAGDAPLLCFRDGSPLSRSASESAFRRLRVHAGVRRAGGARRQPRLHDLRHTAAVHRLTEWYRSGADLQKMLPKLATYLGHVDLSATQRYLTMTPELLQRASLRFECYAMERDDG